MRLLARHMESLRVDSYFKHIAKQADTTTTDFSLHPQVDEVHNALLALDPSVDRESVAQNFRFTPEQVARAKASLIKNGYSYHFYAMSDNLKSAAAYARQAASKSGSDVGLSARSSRSSHFSDGKVSPAIYHSSSKAHVVTVSSTACKLAEWLVGKLGLPQLNPQDKTGVCDLLSSLGEVAFLAGVWTAAVGCTAESVAGIVGAPETGGVSLAAALVTCRATIALSGTAVAGTMAALNCYFKC